MSLAPFGYFAAGASEAISQYWATAETSLGGASDDMAVDGDGNVYWLRNDPTEAKNYVVKFDTLGTVLWQKEAAETASNIEYSQIATDTAGNIYLWDRPDERIVKLDTNGTELWAYTYAGMEPSDLVVDSSGNIYVSSGATDNLMKLNSSGTILWAKSYTEGTTTYRALSLDSSNNPWLLAELNSDLRLFKLDVSDGSIVTEIKKNSSDNWTEMVIDSNGNMYVSYASGSYLYIRKFDTSGTEQGSLRFAASTTLSDHSLAIDSTDNVYLSVFKSTGGESLIVKLNSSMASQWQRTSSSSPSYADPEWTKIAVSGSSFYVSGITTVKLPTDGSFPGGGSYTLYTVNSLDYGYFSSTTLSSTTQTDLSGDSGTTSTSTPTITPSSYTAGFSAGSLTFALTSIG